jgi:hypothetical protein
MKFYRVRFAVLLASGLGVSAALGAGSLDALVQDAPFLAREGAGQSDWPAGADAALEFRGVVAMGGETRVGVFDRATGESFWVPVGAKPGAPGADGAAQPMTVSGYDSKGGQLRLSYQGRVFTLALADAVIGETPTGSGSIAPDDVTEALAATLAQAEPEPEFAGQENGGRRFVMVRFGATPTTAPHDEGNALVFGPRSRSAQPVASVVPEPAPERVVDLTPEEPEQTLAETDPWAGLEDDEVLSAGDDGGRRLLIRRRVGPAGGVRRVD